MTYLKKEFDNQIALIELNLSFYKHMVEVVESEHLRGESNFKYAINVLASPNI